MRDWLKCASIALMSRSRLLLDCAKTKGRTREAKIAQGRMLKRVRRPLGRFNLGSRMVEMKISLEISKPSARDVRSTKYQQSIDKVSTKFDQQRLILVDLGCLSSIGEVRFTIFLVLCD